MVNGKKYEEAINYNLFIFFFEKLFENIENEKNPMSNNFSLLIGFSIIDDEEVYSLHLANARLRSGTAFCRISPTG